MRTKGIGLIAVGVVAGYVSALLIQSESKPTMPLSGDVAGMSAPDMRDSRADREDADLQVQIAALKDELAAERMKNATAAPAAAITGRTPEEVQEFVANASKKIQAQRFQEENDQLLAAGFSMAQIQMFRERSAQLAADRRRAETERRMKGLPVATDLDYINGNDDLDLRNEIGADAYEKYRLATGRQISVPISSVLPGSVAESVGLKPGDKIIRYNNQRVYDMGQVTKIGERDTKAGASLTVEVQREGVPMLFTVPAGTLGIRSSRVLNDDPYGPKQSARPYATPN